MNESPAPGEEDWNTEGVWTRIKNLGEEISNNDPQFLLKVGVCVFLLRVNREANVSRV